MSSISITGMAATGKTTLASKLSEYLDMPYLGINDAWNTIYGTDFPGLPAHRTFESSNESRIEMNEFRSRYLNVHEEFRKMSVKPVILDVPYSKDFSGTKVFLPTDDPFGKANRYSGTTYGETIGQKTLRIREADMRLVNAGRDLFGHNFNMTHSHHYDHVFMSDLHVAFQTISESRKPRISASS